MAAEAAEAAEVVVAPADAARDQDRVPGLADEVLAQVPAPEQGGDQDRGQDVGRDAGRVQVQGQAGAG